MDASHIQNWMQDVVPTSGASENFEDIPLSPLHKEDQSSSTSERFPHVPLEHEIIASESAWDDSATSDEANDQQSIGLTRFSGRSLLAAAANRSSEYSLTAVGDQSQDFSKFSRDKEQEEPSRTSTVLSPHSGTVCTSDPSTPRTASVVTLVETLLALDATSEPTVAVNKVSSPTESLRDQPWVPSISEDISDELRKSSDPVNRSMGPAELTISIPSAKVVAHANFSRAERPETPPASSIPEFFEIPIPIFPFPAGTSRCTNRNCPIKGRHEKGPYLHEGKLRTRKGSMFGSSNPPPEIWFLYDMLRNENLQGTSNKAFAPVELFAKYHFGETRGEYVRGSDDAGGDVRQGVKQGVTKSRFWRLWS